MSIIYKWKKKAPKVDYFGMVSQINFVLEGTDSETDRTESVNTVTVFSEDDEEHIDAWTSDRIDVLAEERRVDADMEAEIARRLAKLDEDDEE